MERVITISFNDNFINRLADYIDDNFIKQGKDLSRIALVFGGKRPAMFLKKELVKRIGKSFFSPAFFSMDEFVDRVVNKNEAFSPISDLDASYIIYKLADELYPSITKGRKAFSRFLPWAQEILSFIEQLDLEAISADSLDIVQLSAKIGFDVPRSINMLLKHIIALRKEYHAKLEKDGTLTKGLRYLKGSQMITKADLDEYDHVIFCNFFYLNKTEKEIVKHIYKSGKGAFIFQRDNGNWGVLDDLAKDLGIKIVPDPASTPGQKLQIRSGFDVQSQACIVREELKGLNKDEKTVVVLPDEDSLIPLISEISSDVGECNISMGYPLKRSSIYSLFEAIFKAQETNKGGKYYAGDYLRAIRHPIVKNFKFLDEEAVTRVLVHKIEECLVGIERTSFNGGIFIGLKDIEELKELPAVTADTLSNMGIDVDEARIKEIIPKLHELVFSPWEKVANFRDFSAILDKFIGHMIKGGFSGSYPLNINVAQRVLDIIDELKSSSFSHEDFPRDEIFRVFLDKLASEKFKFSGSPLKGLQIIGMLETRSLNFDNVIIMDVNEASLPRVNIYQPLIPRDVMISLGLSMHAREEEIQRYHFMRLISSAKNVTLVYKEDGKAERSRFLEELIWKQQKDRNKIDLQLIQSFSFNSPASSTKLSIAKSKEVADFLKGRYYSASSVDTYLKCPLKFYFKSVLGLQEKMELAQDPEGKDIGTFIHDLFHDQFSELKNEKFVLTPAFIKRFMAAFNKKFDSDMMKRMGSDSFLLREVMCRKLGRFLETEKSRSGAIKSIIVLEDAFSDKFDADGSLFNFTGKIDRVDHMKDGSGLIIDYKSGASESMPSSRLVGLEIEWTRDLIKKHIRSFQLPIYLYFTSKGIAKEFKFTDLNAALYTLRDMAISRFCGKLSAEDRKASHDICINALKVLLKEIVDPDVPFAADDSDPRNCSWCEYRNLCR